MNNLEFLATIANLNDMIVTESGLHVDGDLMQYCLEDLHDHGHLEINEYECALYQLNAERYSLHNRMSNRRFTSTFTGEQVSFSELMDDVYSQYRIAAEQEQWPRADISTMGQFHEWYAAVGSWLPRNIGLVRMD